MCPDVVSAWIKSKKKDSPPEIDVEEFTLSFMVWWIALQLGWRLADDGSFNYEMPKDEDWRVLRKGGSAGLYIVVVALSWWIRALTPDNLSFCAWTAVHDVHWVIDQILKTLLPAGKKHPLENSVESSKAKRYVPTLMVTYHIHLFSEAAVVSIPSLGIDTSFAKYLVVPK